MIDPIDSSTAINCSHASVLHQVIALFRRKISLGHFTEALMADALHGRAGALHGLFQSLLGITDALVRKSFKLE